MELPLIASLYTHLAMFITKFHFRVGVVQQILEKDNMKLNIVNLRRLGKR